MSGEKVIEILVPIYREQRYKLEIEAQKHKVSVNRYAAGLCDDDNVVDKNKLLPLVTELRMLVDMDVYVCKNRSVKRMLERLEALCGYCEQVKYCGGEFDSVINLRMKIGLYEKICLRANCAGTSHNEYIRTKFYENSYKVAKSELIPIVYDLFAVFGDENYPHINEEEVLRKIWALI